jgi:DNA-binding GntR family transcriptional regulator
VGRKRKPDPPEAEIAEIRVAKTVKSSKTESALNVIRDSILDFTLRPSSRIDETLLAEQFGLSRTPAREALNRLAAEGLVEIEHNRGAIVSPLDIYSIRDFFNAYFAVERMVGYFCNTGQTNLSIDLRAINAQYADNVKERSYLRLTQINASFHGRIASATENSYIRDFHDRLQNQARRVSYCIFELDRRSENYAPHQKNVISDHEKIVDAIERGDNDTLVELLTEHALLFQKRVHAVMDASRGANAPLPFGFLPNAQARK